MGGAGIQSGQLIAGKSVSAVLTGNVGPNVYQTLQAAGITIVTGVGGLGRDAIESYKNGKLTSTGAPTVPEHFGTKGSK